MFCNSYLCVFVKLITQNMKNNFFAIDLGATSGRTILGAFTEKGVELEEINRFPNKLIETGSHFYWDIYALYQNIIDGLKIVAERGTAITSIGIDTWGVDFAIVGKDGHFLRLPYAYRDPHTVGAPEKFFERMPAEEVYGVTGIQIMNFNSLYQLDTLRRNNDSALAVADKILFMPDALAYMLTGEMVTEYTIASTSQMLDAKNRCFSTALLEAVGLTGSNFGRFIYPGERIGILSEEVQRQTGLGTVPVVAVAGHDTASAVAAVPAVNEDFVYLSSGTWSLMGIEAKSPVITAETEELNFTNEGGVAGTIRLLKNICGMWLLERCRTEWPALSYPELVAEAQKSTPFRSIINPDADVFTNPVDMKEAIQAYCRDTNQAIPATCGELVRCIFESLALRYREVLNDLRQLSGHPLSVLHVIGGGSRNDLLNQFTANSTGIPVVAGPSEATAIGNVMMQAIAAGEATDIADMRKLVNDSILLKRFEPQDGELWNKAYETYQRVVKAYKTKHLF